MNKPIKEKLIQKRRQLTARTAEALGIPLDQAEKMLTINRKQSIRLNPLKDEPGTTLKALCQLGWEGEPFSWISQGYTVGSDLTRLRDSDLVTLGKIYIQNAASWLPVLALNPEEGDAILDVCAAPGGKTSHIAALVNNNASIWANDNSRTRLTKLQNNMERLGAQIEKYTLYDATQLARKLEGWQFDRILLDAPCSGEGLMNLQSDKDFTTWSVAHIKRLQQLQKRLITQAWRLLRPGGTLVYSTCTMAPEENEAVVDYLLRSQNDAIIEHLAIEPPNRVMPVSSWNGKVFNAALQKTLRLAPSEQIEAFFVAKMRKMSQNTD